MTGKGTKKRIWLRITLGILLTPPTLFILLMALLYVPPVQDCIRKQAMSIATESTGMQIDVKRIDLRFPLNLLVRDVCVVQPDGTATEATADTLLSLGSLSMHVQGWPLLRGQVEVDGIELKQISVNSGNLLEGMRIEGTLGKFFLKSHGVNLLQESVVLNNVELEDTHLQVVLADTTSTAVKDTVSTAINWKILLHTLRLKNVSVNLQMPFDTTYLEAKLEEACIDEAFADLGTQHYEIDKFALNATALKYDTGTVGETAYRQRTYSQGFDPSHIELRDIKVAIDSVYYRDKDIKAVLREVSMYERSGLCISSLNGSLDADSTMIRIPSLQLLTPNSEINITAQTYWELVEIPTTGRLTARLDARIGKQDILLLAGEMPDSFKEAYPSHPIVIHAGTEGNLKQMQLSGFSVNLPGAFYINGHGEMHNIADSLDRMVALEMEMQTRDLNFITSMTGGNTDTGFIIPDSMDLDARLDLKGNECRALLDIREGKGSLNMKADYNLATEHYCADLEIDSLQINHFLPQDSIGLLTARLSAKGEGTNFTASATTAEVALTLRQLQYGHIDVTGVKVKAVLHSSVASMKLESDNPLLKMKADASIRLNYPYTVGHANIRVSDVALHNLGLIPAAMEEPFAFTLAAKAGKDSIALQLKAGDLDMEIHAKNNVEKLAEQAEDFVSVLMRQIEERHLDHAALRKVLPSAGMQLHAGGNNPVGRILAMQGMTFDGLKVQFGVTPDTGINGRAAVHGIKTDSLQLDTIFFSVHQDTTRMRLQGGVINGPDNPAFVFRSTVTGEIRNEDAELTLNFTDKDGETGILFGLNARPLAEEKGKIHGVLLNLIPEEPVVAFRKFSFPGGNNQIYLHNNMHVYANVDMVGTDGMAFRMHSDPRDTLSMQNIDIELSRFRLNELSEVMPYMPRLTGLFSAEANYIQSDSTLQFSAETEVQALTYEGQPVGNISLGATWLPSGKDMHYLAAFLTFDGQEVLAVDGTLRQRDEQTDLSVETRIERLPLSVANAFLPDKIAMLKGYAGGTLSVSGSLDRPELQGELAVDSATVSMPQMGAHFFLDNRPLTIADNKLNFNKFSIYTTSSNPFVIDGYIDFSDMNRMIADITLQAHNYTLLQAERKRNSMVYGKLDVDINAKAQGPLDALSMRGNMNLLGTTNITYVLTDSPLTVEDRLTGLVTFVNFKDTLDSQTGTDAPIHLGGMEMFLSVHIDDAVRLRADLSQDRSKYIELEGGGDLSLQYTRQGDMTLNGRYTLTGGTMKYSLPIIPLKEFSINPGSYVDWRGDIMDPSLDLKATERVRASVSDGDDSGSSRIVAFDVSIGISNRLSSPDLIFDIAAPEDATVQNELQSMGQEERSKQAIAMLATGIYLNSSGGGLTMGSALNSVLQNQINALAGSAVKNASISVGVEDRTSSETGDKQTDYSFRYSQRFFNDRFQIVIGGKVSTGENATNSAESFIDNISLEYRLDTSGTRYVRVFHNKNYESILDGEITETGAGIVLRKKLDRLSELFIFKRRKR